MRLDLFRNRDNDSHDTHSNILRAEIPLIAPDQQQYKIIILDADDSFDLVVQYPDNEREIVWSLVKAPE